MTPRDIILNQIHHHETQPVPYTLYFEGDIAEQLDAHYGDAQWRERIQTFIMDKTKKDEDDPERQTINRRTLEALAKAMEELSEVLRTTLVLVVFQNVDYKQASEILGCSEGTVAWRVFRAREILREKLKGHLT